MWQPRLGLAWNPRSSTVVRVSSGLYDAPSPATLFQRAFSENGVNTFALDSYFTPGLIGSVAPLASPPVLPNLVNGVVSSVARDFRNPRSFQVSGTVEQQLTRTVTASAGYLRNSTWRLPRTLNDNLLPPAVTASGLPVFPEARPDPAVGEHRLTESTAHSSYDGLLLTATVQLPRRSSLSANYTFPAHGMTTRRWGLSHACRRSIPSTWPWSGRTPRSTCATISISAR
jgi:hypothetical protein